MLESKVELPINMDNLECVTECWTRNRMIVLKTSPHYEDWVASHYSLCALKEIKDDGYLYSFFFGETNLYTPDYYDDILECRQIRYFEQTEDSLIDLLRGEIQNGYYINIMIKPRPDTEADWIHEIVLYGYDDHKKLFKAVGSGDHSFERLEYSYSFLKEMLPIMKEFFIKDQERGIGLSMHFQYPISAFRLRESYNTEGCVFEAFRKIREELFGKRYEVDDLRDAGAYKQNGTIHRGISCLHGLSSYISDILEGEASDIKLTKIIKKLHEHRKMMLISMRYIQKGWDAAIDEDVLAECIAAYEGCSLIVGCWVNMAIKYELTGQKRLLNKILEQIPEAMEKEYSILSKVVNGGIDYEKLNENYV